MVDPGRQPDSLFRTVCATLRQGTYTFRLATREQRPKLSDSLVNSPPVVNRPVRTGTYYDFELPPSWGGVTERSGCPRVQVTCQPSNHDLARLFVEEEVDTEAVTVVLGRALPQMKLDELPLIRARRVANEVGFAMLSGTLSRN